MTDADLDRWLLQGDPAAAGADRDAEVFVAGVTRRVAAAQRRRGVVLAGAAGVGTAVSLVAMSAAAPAAGGAIGSLDLASALVLAAACALVWVASGSWPAIPAGIVAQPDAGSE